MNERLMCKFDIAATLGTSPDIAAQTLAKYGCHSIDLGRGRSRGKRWLESAVKAALQKMQHMANQSASSGVKKGQPKNTPLMPKIRIFGGAKQVADMSTDELKTLVDRIRLPERPTIQ